MALLRRLESARYTRIPERVYEIGEMIRRHASAPDDDATAAWAVWHAVPERT
ncbi:hypothetical protein AB0A95_18000 [Micromonospora sp. NPDC049230]|uniref:hypothetical protein n=1 Tax=Micromonospora sp. NPDC049230 TaxID=3155502 RepID=UPI0033E39571